MPCEPRGPSEPRGSFQPARLTGETSVWYVASVIAISGTGSVARLAAQPAAWWYWSLSEEASALA